jgi:hypothetical protein
MTAPAAPSDLALGLAAALLSGPWRQDEMVAVVPRAVWRSGARPADDRDLDRHHRLGRSLGTAHLPQGAPTSPAPALLEMLAQAVGSSRSDDS